MKYFLSVGEASGDIHAAELIKELRKVDSGAEFVYLGGDLMREAAGCEPVVDYRDMAYMGFSEVLRNLDKVFGNLRRAKEALRQSTPDALILVDYPSFNLKLAKAAHQLGIPVFYYISPKVWAWKEYRVKEIKEYVTEMYSILPFETEFFARHNYKVEYVGNPTVNEIDEAKQNFRSRELFCKENGIDEQRELLALLPGSRKKEVKDNLKEMLGAVSQFADCQPIVCGAPGLSPEFYDSVFAKLGYSEHKPKVLFGKSFEMVHHAKAALVTSGTATLETAILRTPQVVCYRMGGSRLIYELYSRVLKVKYVSLPNLIADAPVVKELLLHHCNAENIAAELTLLLDQEGEYYKKQQAGYDEIARRLTNAPSAATAACRLIDKLKKK